MEVEPAHYDRVSIRFSEADPSFSPKISNTIETRIGEQP